MHLFGACTLRNFHAQIQDQIEMQICHDFDGKKQVYNCTYQLVYLDTTRLSILAYLFPPIFLFGLLVHSVARSTKGEKT